MKHTRKSDIELAWKIYEQSIAVDPHEEALRAAYDLGHASGLEAAWSNPWSCEWWHKSAKRLRAKVRKAAEGER